MGTHIQSNRFGLAPPHACHAPFLTSISEKNYRVIRYIFFFFFLLTFATQYWPSVKMASPSLDSLLEAALAGSRPSSAQDMLMLAVHASLISSGYECIAIGDDVRKLYHDLLFAVSA